MTALEDRTTNSATSDMARDRLWMHFTRHSTYENGGEVPIITRGEGAYIYDEHGRKYLDGLAGLFTVQIGHGRRPYATIGKAVGLSEAAVRQRVSKLLETGVMQIVAVTDPLQVGFNREAMIGIEVDGDMEAVADVLSLMDEISYIILTAGSFDIILEVVCEDDEALLEVINRKIRAIPGVRRTETFMYLKLRKQSYTWGTR